MSSHLFTIGPEHLSVSLNSPMLIRSQRRAISNAIGSLCKSDIGKRVYGKDLSCVSVESDSQRDERIKNHKYQIIKPGDDAQERATTFGTTLASLELNREKSRLLMLQMRRIYEEDCRILGIQFVPDGTIEQPQSGGKESHGNGIQAGGRDPQESSVDGPREEGSEG